MNRSNRSGCSSRSNRWNRSIRSIRSSWRKDLFVLSLFASLVTLAGCSIGSRRIRSSDYPFDFKINCLFTGWHVVLFLIDGARADLLYGMADDGELPTIKKYFMDRGVVAEHAITSIPSITNAAIAAITCGDYPGHVNVIGNTWFDRDELKRINLLSLRNYYLANGYLARKTIYQILSDQPTVTVSTLCNRGSRYNIHLHYNLVGMGNYLIGKWNKVDEIFIQEFQDVVEYANREDIFPRVTFFHLPGMDYTSHSHGPFSKEARSILMNIDRVLGELMEGLEKNGVLDNVCLILLADHGQVPLESENYFLWEEFFSKRLMLPILSRYGETDEYFTRALGITTLTRYNEINKKRRSRREKYYSHFAVIEANNGRNAFLYFRHNPAGRWVDPREMAPWEIRPGWEELRNYATPRGTVDLVSEISRAEEIALVAGQQRKGEVIISSRSGEGLIKTRQINGETRYSYQVIRGEDPLGYRQSDPAVRLMDGNYHPSREWLEATASLRQVDVVAQLPSLFESRYCGDLFVVPVDGWDFEKVNPRGSHGGFLKGEMRIPLIIAGPRVKTGMLRNPVRSVDIVPTILDYLGFGERKEGLYLDGQSFWKEIKQ
jgi:hypothetical protein